MAGAGEGIRGSGGSKKQAEVALPAEASGAGVGTVSPHSGETHTSGNGHSPAQQLMEALRKSQEEIAGMGVAEVLAYQERLQALRLRVLQRIKEEQEKIAPAEQATAPAPRRAG
jgi:hypothetical protein